MARQVTVHVTFHKLGDICTGNQEYQADVVVASRWREPALDSYREKIILQNGTVDWKKLWHPKIFIENTDTCPKSETRKVVFNDQNEAFVLERKRFHGAFQETMELWDFPFDVQNLGLRVMSDLPLHEVELVEDPEAVHKIYRQCFTDEQEWTLYKCVASEKREFAYDTADPTKKNSCLKVLCHAARKAEYFVWNNYIITFLIGLLAINTFVIPEVEVHNRLGASMGLLLTIIAHKFAVDGSLPRISYLTHLDKYFYFTLAITVLISFAHSFCYLFEGISIWMVIAFGALYGIYNIAYIARMINVPFSRRRAMRKEEELYLARLAMDKNRRSNFTMDIDDSVAFATAPGYTNPGYGTLG